MRPALGRPRLRVASLWIRHRRCLSGASSALPAAGLPSGLRTCRSSCSSSRRRAGTGPCSPFAAQRLHREREIELLVNHLAEVDAPVLIERRVDVLFCDFDPSPSERLGDGQMRRSKAASTAPHGSRQRLHTSSIVVRIRPAMRTFSLSLFVAASSTTGAITRYSSSTVRAELGTVWSSRPVPSRIRLTSIASIAYGQPNADRADPQV